MDGMGNCLREHGNLTSNYLTEENMPAKPQQLMNPQEELRLTSPSLTHYWILTSKILCRWSQLLYAQERVHDWESVFYIIPQPSFWTLIPSVSYSMMFPEPWSWWFDVPFMPEYSIVNYLFSAFGQFWVPAVSRHWTLPKEASLTQLNINTTLWTWLYRKDSGRLIISVQQNNSNSYSTRTFDIPRPAILTSFVVQDKNFLLWNMHQIQTENAWFLP